MPDDRIPEDWRYRLRIPALDLPAYRRLNAAMLRPYLRSGAWRRFAIVLGVGMLVGGLGGYLSAIFAAELLIWFHAEPDHTIELQGARAFMALVALVLLTMIFIRILTSAWQRRLLRRLHAASGSLLAEHPSAPRR